MALRKKDGFKGQRLIVIPESIRRILIENPITNSLYLSDIGYYPTIVNGGEGHPKIY